MMMRCLSCKLILCSLLRLWQTPLWHRCWSCVLAECMGRMGSYRGPDCAGGWVGAQGAAGVTEGSRAQIWQQNLVETARTAVARE